MRRRLVMVLLALGATCVSATAAGASCAPTLPVDEALEQSDLVFVGTPVSLAHGGRWATFVVERLWKGDIGAERVEVRGGPPGGDGNGAATSVDRTYQLGTRYLVFSQAVSSPGDRSYGAGARWSDNACSATQPYTSGLDQFRPARVAALDERTPPPTIRPALPARITETGGELAWAWVPGILTLAIVLGVIFIPHRGRAKEPVRP